MDLLISSRLRSVLRTQHRHFAAASAAVDMRLSPAARYILSNNKDLNLAQVKGSGKSGMIVKGDLLPLLSQPKAPAPNPVAAAAPLTVATGLVAPVNGNYTDLPLTTMRKVIAKRLTESKQSVPHSYTEISVEIDAILSHRKMLARDFNVNISVNDAVIKAAALALKDVPEANARYDSQRQSVALNPSIDISVAVATPTGLITPIVTNANGRGLVDINSTVKDLAARARAGKLKPAEFQGGSFSISNLGMFGVSSFSAVINPPQSCILAVGAGIPRIVAVNNTNKNTTNNATTDSNTKKLKVVTQLTVQLSADRRVVTEAVAAQFLQAFRGYLSNPAALSL